MLGKLEKVELRDVWKHEAIDFTKWLAKEKNIDLLSDTIGIDIEVIETEASVGSFNVDILARDSSTDSKIIIENQLERTDHDHLGKIITYASGYDAETIIWLVKDAKDEHKKAIEWLNNHLDEKINMFLIRIEVWKIGDSQPAPRFSVLESPNNWAKVIKSSSNSGKRELTDTKKLQLEFWTNLKEYGEDNYSSLKFRTVRSQNCYNLSAGSSLYYILLTENSKTKQLGVGIYIYRDKDCYRNFFEKKREIEKELEFNLEWQELIDKKASKIIIYKEFDIKNKESWVEGYNWLLDKAQKMKLVFGKNK
ncbi:MULTISPECIES: DUF4268 domain-containing protein [Psychrilyobacter]|uniref:DUF4268 domain-containing protein n=1 Tax=Psychrilyobacter piezotolerans TaxID=2293438 RepID=A0ABX9KIL9_9FUSO|nr:MULTISPECIES: DUF4268 domain-containing protein [Psychrilyobacter]MCS5420291.1 DUF4268 domain-containing protein [Psychrilyobacter sp. S5]NDI77317.1 DUF4268 domain-containing protein [Psychrilyobacter piezotolerans]RDE63368.1 DUF4268 domain-containing protein [Psychrilyobacter sp. S5]REI41910.1 DUF4268 domain-containing protein [Psychrilyobacter piezotolerans]